jgi:hypothetical protein
MPGYDLMVWIYDLPIIFLVISSLTAPLTFIVAFSSRREILGRVLGGAILAACSVVAGGLYLTYRVILTWHPILDGHPVPSLEAAITEFFPGFVFHLTGALVIGSIFSFLVLKGYRDIDAKTYLLTSLSVGAICSTALIVGSFNPILYLFALLIIPGVLWEVYYEWRRRGSTYTRYFKITVLLLVMQVCALVVYFGLLVTLGLLFSPWV